jgi:hypothetical protein
MERVRVSSRSLPLLMLFVVLSHAAATAPSEREKWIIGRWTSHIEGKPKRILVFHTDHSWGVEHYRVSGPNDQLTIYEDIRGRRWHIRGDKLVLRAPSDGGFKSYGEKIISFRHDKIVTDIATYTREKLTVRKQNELLQQRNKLPPYDQDSEKRYYGPQSKP